MCERERERDCVCTRVCVWKRNHGKFQQDQKNVNRGFCMKKLLIIFFQLKTGNNFVTLKEKSHVSPVVWLKILLFMIKHSIFIRYYILYIIKYSNFSPTFFNNRRCTNKESSEEENLRVSYYEEIRILSEIRVKGLCLRFIPFCSTGHYQECQESKTSCGKLRYIRSWNSHILSPFPFEICR